MKNTLLLLYGLPLFAMAQTNTFPDSGNVGVETVNPDAKLTLKDKNHAEEVRIDLSVPGPDYVFAANYELPDLKELQDHIQQHGHLSNIPSAVEMGENGVELGLMNMKLLEKIEELTLVYFKARGKAG